MRPTSTIQHQPPSNDPAEPALLAGLEAKEARGQGTGATGMDKDTQEPDPDDARERLLGEEPHEPDPDVDYESFVERIAEAVHEAELQFGLPSGAISEVYKDSDFVFTLKVYGIVEPLLREVVTKELRQRLNKPKIGTATSDALIKVVGRLGYDRLRIIASETGIIDSATSDWLDGIARIRSIYGQNINNMHLSIAEACGKSRDKLIQSKITHLSNDFFRNGTMSDEQFRTLVFYGVALFLRNALPTLQVPSVPSRGTLSSLQEHYVRALESEKGS